MEYLYPVRLEASLHETIWGGRRLERDGWKQLVPGSDTIGESWETEVSTVVQNGAYAGQSLGTVVEKFGPSFLGEQAIAIFGRRFPLLAKFIDANAQLSVQVHPEDHYAALHEGGKLGKTEFWYILAAEPDARIVHGFKAATSRREVHQAIHDVALERLLHEESVQAGDVIFVPAGTVHAIGRGVLLYELQEYSDVTYRMYDYGRLTSTGKPRDLHIDRSLDVSRYEVSRQIKMKPVSLPTNDGYEDRCLVACKYFVTRELHFKPSDRSFVRSPMGQQRETVPVSGAMSGKTEGSCVILSSLDGRVQVRYGASLAQAESLSRGQTMVLPAALGDYRLEGDGVLLCSYVPTPDDPAWQAWREKNSESAQ